MIEVKNNQLLPGAAPSMVVDKAQVKVDVVSKGLPVSASDNVEKVVKAAVVTTETVSKAVAQMNEFVQNEQRDLLFSVDDGTGDIVIRVSDSKSGELIRQIPGETFLKLAEHARNHEPVHLISVNG